MVSSGRTQWQRYCVSVGATIVLAAGVVFAPAAWALGLGEIETRSALNERFSAEIELLDTRGLQASEVIASLASTDDFRRVGVERFFFLTSLQFEVQRNARGNLVVRSTSQQPITEPYLNFLVEVLWPSGRLLKEYTVLLDPPTFTHSAASPVATPNTESSDIASAGRIDRGSDVAVRAPSTRTSTRSAAPSVASTNADGTYGRTTRTDTMWAIANRTLPSGNVTPQQNMLAIQRLNPTAFIDGNVNLLKAGVVLRLPSEADAGEISSNAAVAEVDRQTEAWRTGSPTRAIASNTAETGDPQTAAPIDATSRGSGVADNGTANADGRLRIVAAEATGATSEIDSAGASEAGVATAGDPAAQEQLEAMARQVDELTYQLDLQKRGVEQQISARDEQISIKDQEIAQLQEQLKAMRENVGTAAQPQDQSTSPSDAAADATPFWQKPAVLGSALGALALLLAGVLFKRRRDNAAEELEMDNYATAEPSFELGPSGTSEVVTPIGDAELVGDLAEADLALEAATEVEAETDLAGQDALDESPVSQDIGDELSDDDLFGPSDDAAAPAAASNEAVQGADAIGEADIYIAYGRYPQAIALLQGAVDTDPKDHQVRMRLIEVCAETKDAEGYAQQLGLLRQNCDDPEILASASSLHDSLDDDFSSQVDALIGSGSAVADIESNAETSGGIGATGVVAGAGAALAAGAASLLGDDAEADDLDASLDNALDNDNSLLDDDLTIDSSDALDVAGDVANVDDFELDLDDGLAAADVPDLDAAASDLDLDLGSDLDTELDIPTVNTDEFSTNVEMDAALPDTDVSADDFELDLDPDASAALAELSTDDAEAALGDSLDGDSLGGDLGIDFPDEPEELERVVAETDDDELLDEIERSLDELEADGLLTPDLSDEGDFSFEDDADTSATKLDLARAYIDMGDDDGAREILGEVLTEGDSNQQGEANELLGKL